MRSWMDVYKGGNKVVFAYEPQALFEGPGDPAITEVLASYKS